MATVVVLDDDEQIRNFVTLLLRIDNHQVKAFDDGAPALEIVDFSTVDLLITDLRMPTPGDLVIRTLRQKGIQVPIIVMSGQIQPDEMDYLLSLGVQTVFQKPFSVAELNDSVKKILGVQKQSSIIR